MKFLFRVDAGGEVGLGHFFRTKAIADMLFTRGHLILYTANYSDFWSKIFKFFPYPVFFLNTSLFNEELAIIETHEVDIFYVDGLIEYSEEYLNKIKSKAKIVFYQNLTSCRFFADVFIQPALHQSRDFYFGFKENTIIYKGLDYFILNSELGKLEPKYISEKVESIGIITGGSDPNNTLIQIFNKIDYKRFEDIKFNFFYGIDYIYKSDLPSILDENVFFYEFDHELVYNNDLLISAFGVSTYEYLALGFPIIAFGHKESNAYASDYLANSSQAFKSLGLISSLTSEMIIQEIERLVSIDDVRIKYSNNAQKLIDFKGANRVVNILEKLK